MHITTAFEFLAGVLDQPLVSQVLAAEREALWLVIVLQRGRGRALTRPWRQLARSAGRHLAAQARLGGAPAIEVDAHADAPVALALGDPLGHHFAQDLALHVRELEILEHDLDQLLERDVGLVVVDPRLIAGASRSVAVLLRLADHLPRLGAALAGAGLGLVVAIDEPVFLDAPDRDLDDPVAVAADDRLFGDDVGDIVPDRLAQLFAMALPVARAAVRAQRVRG